MAAHIDWIPRIFGEETRDPGAMKFRHRPLPLRLRTYSITGFRSPGFDENRDGYHPRNKSISVAADLTELSPTRTEPEPEPEPDADLAERESPRTSLEDSVASSSIAASPPESPRTALTSIPSGRSSLEHDGPDLVSYDFSRIDYELERAKVLGQGLWSTVYLAEQKRTQPRRLIVPSFNTPKPPTPSKPTRRARFGSAPGLFAVKTPARPDAKEIFLQEARVLSHLQRSSTFAQHVVPFYGLDERNGSLVFEAVIGGSLESMASRMKQMTEVARHLELIDSFPGIAYDLIHGLAFLHAHGVVHADIKPGNILLDISEHATQRRPVVRARYIDFSAAFVPAAHGDAAAAAANNNAGGTWDYLAPEQLRIFDPDLSRPSFPSDVWSLGVTLLYLLVGDSPYAAACAGNLFRLREAIKTGDPLHFARLHPVPHKRLAACQDFVDICRQALKKDRDNRTSAAAWAVWLEEFGR